MMIVASNSITVSNVNDGTVVHIAYANSADGTDGFYAGGGTNLVTGTNQEYVMGFGIPNTTWQDGYAFETLPLASGAGEILPQSPHTFSYTLTQGTTYTQTIWIETDANVKDLSAVKITWWTSAGHDYRQAIVQNLGQNSYKIISTYTWPGKTYNNVRLFDIGSLGNGFDLTTGTYLKFGKLKFEEGNVSTPWTPAPSEAHPTYMGTYTDYNQEDSLDPTKYAWSLIKGADGQSVWSYPYNRGANRLGSYWSDLKPAPTTDNPPKVGDTIVDMIGNMYQITNVVVGTSSTGGGTFDYGSLLTSIKGNDGKDGVGIKSTIITYQLSSSGTTTPTGTWLTAVPTLTKGQYLWTRTTLVYTDNTNNGVYSVSYVAQDGNNGTNGVAGKDGVGINSTTITYQSGTSGTVQPTGTWVANPPSVTGGNYLWTRTVWSYTDGTSETGYSVAKAGEKGDKGADGAQGIPGTSSYTHIAYATNATGTTGFDVSVATGKTYIGMYVDSVSTDSTDPTKYTWSLIKGADGAQGIQGPTGADGKTSYFHTAYATNATGTTGFSTTDATGKTYLGTYTDFTSADSTTASDYTWSLIKGADGAQGIPGTSVTITSTSIQYAISTSATVTPTTWVNTVPATQLGKYMWTKTSVTYSNGTSTVAYSVALSGVNGADGVNSEIISSDTPPASPTANSFWNDTSTTPNVLKVYRSGGWVVYQFTAENIASGSITADKIATKAITASKIDMNEVTYQIEDSSKNLLRNTGFQPTSKSGYISDGWSGVFYRNNFGQRNYLTNSEFTPYNSPDWNIILPDTLARARSTTAGYNGSKGIRIDTNSEADGYAGYSGISQIVPVPVGATMVSMRVMVYTTALSSDNGTYLDGDIIAYDKNNKIITTLVPLGTPYAHDVGKWVSSNSRFLNVSIPSGTASIGFRQYLRGKGIVTFSQPMVVFDTVIGDYVSDAVVDKPNKLNKVVNSEFQADLSGWNWGDTNKNQSDNSSYNLSDSYKGSPAFSYDGSSTARINLASDPMYVRNPAQPFSVSAWVKGVGIIQVSGYSTDTKTTTTIGDSWWSASFNSSSWTKITYENVKINAGTTNTAKYLGLTVYSTNTAFSVAQPMLVFDTTVGNYLKGPMPVIGDYVPGIGRTDNTVNELTNTEFSPDFRGWDITDGLASVTQVPGYNGSNAIRLDASNATADNNTYKYLNSTKVGDVISSAVNTVPQVNRNYIVNSSGLNASATTRPTLRGTTSGSNVTVTYPSDGILMTNGATNTTTEWYYQVANAWTNFSATSILPGSTYTFSADVMGTVPQVALRYGFNGGTGGLETFSAFSINNTSWTRVSITITPTTSNTGLYLRIQGAINNQYATGWTGGETLKFRNVKLEPGSVATPWSLAPEDTMTIPATKPDNSIPVPKGAKTFSLRVMGYIESISSNSNSYVNTNVTAFDDMGVSLGDPLAAGNLLNKSIIGSWQQSHARALNVALPDNTAYLEVHMYLRGQGIVIFSQPMITFDSTPGDYVPGAIAGNDISTVNLLPNSEFLSSLGGWYGGGSAVSPFNTPVVSTAYAIDNQSMWGSNVFRRDQTADYQVSGIHSELIPASAGVAYTWSVWVKVSADYDKAKGDISSNIRFYDINKNYISSGPTAASSTLPTSWGKLLGTATAPSNTSYMSLTLYEVDYSGTGYSYYSQPIVAQGTSAPVYEPSLNYPTSRVEIVGDNFDTTTDSNGNTSDRGIAIPASSTSTTILVENWNRTDGVSDYVFGLWAKTTSPVTISVGNISNVLYGTNPITTLGDGYWRNYEMKVNFVGTQGALPITISASPAEVRLARFMLVRRDTALGGAWLAAPEDNLANTQQLTDQITQSFSLGNGQLRSVISNLNSGYTSSFIQDSNGNMQSITQGDTLVSAINLTPDGVYIKGNKIQLDGNVNVTGAFYALGGNFTNLNATNITTGALNASLITTGTLDASKITVTNLSATSITTGTINGITITGSTINGGTINASSTINFVVGVNSADMGIYGNSMFSSTYGTSIWSGTGTVSATTGFKLSGTYSYKPDRSEYTTVVNSSTTIANSVIVLADDTTDPRANRLILSSQGMMLANSNTTDYPYFSAGTGGVFAKEYHTYDLRQWTSVSLTSAFSTYNSDSSLALRYYKDQFSKIVYLQGQITPKATIPSGTSVKIGSLITDFGNYTPEIPVVLLQQGTGSNRWLLTVNPNGDITFSRYGNTDYANANAGNWLPITASWPTEIY